jgi:phosphotransferase family enzyme
MTERRRDDARVGAAAVSAWAAVHPSGARASASAAVTLKPFAGGSAVYRLVGMGPRGSDVIAKWTGRATVEREARLYADLLADLPVATVRCYGHAPDGDETMGWLFLADAGGLPYAPARREHRRLAARWLAALHTAATSSSMPSALSARDAAYYRDVLERSRRAIVDGLGNPALGPADVASLLAVVRRSELLLDRWSDVEQLCAAMPHTLVHADFVAKNVRVHQGTSGRTLLAFDWENAGWGPPAIDLPSVDLDEYARAIRGAWPMFGRSDMATVARVGRVLWFTSCIAWEGWALQSDSVWRLTKNMPVYERELGMVIAELGWI